MESRCRSFQVALAILALVPGPARASEESARKLAAFREQFEKGSPDVRVAAIEDLAGSDDLQITKRLVSAAFQDPESVVNMAGVKVLGGLKDKASIDWLLTVPIKSDKMQVRYLTVETLSRLQDPRVPEALVSRLTDSSWLVAATAARGLAAQKASQTVEKILPLLQHKDQRVRVAALDAVADLGASSAVPDLLKLLDKEKEWRVKSALCDTLVALKAKDAVPVLRKQMQGSDGRLKDDFAKAIQALRTEEGAGDNSLINYGMKYHGIGSNSKRVVFILDCSESMKAPLGSAAKEAKLEEGCEATKLGVCQSELIRALQQLQKEPGAKFNLIFVHGENDIWEKSLVPASADKVALAIKHLKRQTANGRTNLCDALLSALEIEDAGAVALKPEDLKEAPDTIFVLSDGLDPNEGKHKRSSDLLEAVRDVNRYARARIHGIGTGTADFLRKLSAENGGILVTKVEF